MLIREIKNKDLENCSDLYSRVFSNPPWSEKWSKETAYKRMNHFFHSRGFVGVLSENKNITGFVLGNTEPFMDGSLFYLREMCVDTVHQGQSIGTKLLNELKIKLISSSVGSIYLATERDIPAASFYEKNGFSQNSKMAFYYKRL